MRVLIFDESLSPLGGVEVQALFVCQELARRGHEMDIIYLEDGELHSDFEAICRSLVQVPTFHFWRAHAFRTGIRMLPTVRRILHSRPDVIYPQRTGEIVCALLAGRLARVPVVCHLHGFRATRSSRSTAAHVAKFIAVSRFIREEWLSIGLEPDSIDVVHNGVDSKDYPFGGLAERARARRALGLPEDGFLALYCGRLDPVKGIEVLLDAWRLLGLDPAGNRLLVVGSPEPDAEGAAFGQALVEGAPPGCHWLPSRRDVTTPFHAADVVVVPSLVKESFGRVVVEAMVTGRPVVAARVGGIPEILDGEFSRFLFDRGDAASLADRLIAVADWREREPTLAEVCRAHVKENFTGQAMVDGIERVLLEAVRTSRNGS